jgi:ABC-type transport system involved in multi-copper enzyme maturation permease subunit
MYLFENPVLQRELLVNLRMTRAFVLLFCYLALLGLVVYLAWPTSQTLDLTTTPQEAKRLIDLFFVGQYVLMSLMAPSFAAGTIAGEKERKTYEMLLASPLRPAAIVLGKLLASLSHLAVLVFCSLPIVMLCLPLGGKHFSEIVATYVAMAASVATFGMISLAASSYFKRTIAAVVVSYLVILPLVLFGVLFYRAFESVAAFRLVMLAGIFPAGCVFVCLLLLATISRRLMYPPDVGAEAEEVVDLDEEQREAVGMVIRSDQFPDKLFAPPKREDLMADAVNPVYDKEMRSELFGHGTLMLRLVIQMSMGLALLVMAACLYIWPQNAPWYTSYVLLFNMLVGPVFSAGAVTNERERQTLELLLTTALTPWQILAGKMTSSLRVSVVLTSFLVWPILLAWLLPPWTYWRDTLTILWYLAVILVTCLTTTTLAVFCSVIFRKTSISMMTVYLVLIVLFAVPVVAKVFSDLLFPAPAQLIHAERMEAISRPAKFLLTGPGGQSAEIEVTPGEPLRRVADRINALNSRLGQVLNVRAAVNGNQLLIGTDLDLPVALRVLEGEFSTRAPAEAWIARFGFTSPFAAAFSLPLTVSTQQGQDRMGPGAPPTPRSPEQGSRGLRWSLYTAPAYVVLYLLVDLAAIWIILRLFNVRWRVAR